MRANVAIREATGELISVPVSMSWRMDGGFVGRQWGVKESRLPDCHRLQGFANSGGRRKCRNSARSAATWIAITGVRREIDRVTEDTVYGTAKRVTPRRHELRKVIRRAQGRGR